MHTKNIIHLVLVALLAGLTPSGAETLTVISSNDSGSGTLRQAIANASSGDLIRFESNLDGKEIRLSTPLAPTTDIVIDASELPQGIKLLNPVLYIFVIVLHDPSN